VADVVPLLDENRVLVRYGLKAMERSARPGLQELRIVARCRGPVDTTALAFFLAPRLNVAGRLEKPDLALDLLRAKDPEEGRRIAQRLNELNGQRQQLQKQGVREAQALITAEVLERERLLCVLGEEWGLGVIGLIASNLSEAFHRPAVVVTDVQRNGVYVGSARSIPGYDINEGISSCARFLTTYGGHAAAAGFSLEAGCFEEFRAELVDHASARLRPEDMEAQLDIDLELKPADIHMSTVELLRRIEPFGQGHPVPLFAACDLEVAAVKRIGKQGEHLKLAFHVDGGSRSAVWWRQGGVASELEIGSRVDVAFELSEDTFHGNGTVQMVVRDVRPAGAADGIDIGDTTIGAQDVSREPLDEPELAGVTQDTSR
jgi:single-stranded-DNA-specific exonuclease